MEQYGLAGKNASEKSALAEDRMNAYVDANVDVPNSYNTARSGNNDDVAIIQDVHDDFDRRIQEQTTYDYLIKIAFRTALPQTTTQLTPHTARM